MGEAAGEISDPEEKIKIADLLIEYEDTINVTRRFLKKVPNAALPRRVGWDQVVGMAQDFAGEATSVVKLWSESVSDLQSLADHMQEYFGLLQRVIILAHGATRDAGSTLGDGIQMAVDHFVGVSLNLIREAVFSYDSEEESDAVDTMLKLVASFWDSFDALKKIPPNNVIAIGEAIGQVAFSVEKNLRIMKELNEASSDDPPNEVEDKASGDIGSNTKVVEKGSCDPPEKLGDRASGAEGSDAKEVEKGSCVPPEKVEDRASGVAEIDTKDQRKKGSCDPPEKVENRASGAAESDTKDQLKKGSCDPPEKFEDKASGAAEIDMEDQQKKGSYDPPEMVEDSSSGAAETGTKDQQKKGSCDPPEKVEDSSSGAAEINTIDQQKKGSCDPPEKVEDRASGAAEIDTKDQQKKGSCDLPEKFEDKAFGAAEIDTEDQQKNGSCDPPEKVEDSSSGAAEIDTKDQQKKGSCDPPEKFEVMASGAAEIDRKDLKKCSSDPPNEVKDKASGAAESGSKTLNLKEPKKESCGPPEEMDIAQLTIDTVSAILDMLIHLSPVVIGLLNKEREGNIPNFIDSLENILKLCKAIESQTEAFIHLDQDLSPMRTVAPINIYTVIREMAVILYGVGVSSHGSPEFSQARSRSIVLLRQLREVSFKKEGYNVT